MAASFLPAGSFKQEKFRRDQVEYFPRTFKGVARVLREVKTRNRSLKSAVYASKCKGAVLRRIYGMASNVLKSMPAIDFIWKEMNRPENNLLMSREVFDILVHEIINKRPLPGKSKPVLLMEEFRHEIEKVYSTFEGRKAVESISANYVPRYARIQTISTTVDAVLKALHHDGYVQKFVDSNISIDEYQERIRDLKRGEFLQDTVFKDILIFPKGENLVNSRVYKDGHIFLQDKASCLPVCALDPAPGSIVMDCCAAPGMKTAHIACMMKNTGNIYAIDKNSSRFSVLHDTLERGSVESCTCVCEDFTNINPAEEPYSSAQYILLDPSCSGSGIVDRIDYLEKNNAGHSLPRLERLARFQITLLKHALSFPNVRRVVYSTCSVHEEENEYVVQEALNHFSDAFKVGLALPEWPTRGSEKYSFGNLCVRAFPEKNMTNGFFVAVLERIEEFSEEKTDYGEIRQKKRKCSDRPCLESNSTELEEHSPNQSKCDDNGSFRSEEESPVTKSSSVLEASPSFKMDNKHEKGQMNVASLCKKSRKCKKKRRDKTKCTAKN